MKLLNRTSYILITTILFIFFFGSITFYVLLKNTTEKENLEELHSRQRSLETEIAEKNEKFPELSIPGYLFIEHIQEKCIQQTRITDTLIVNDEQGSYQLYKVLISEYSANGQCYRIEIYKSLVESNDLIEKIILVVTIILLLLIFLTYLLNRFMFERIWSDFFSTVEKLQHYDMNTGSKIHFDESEITEFDLLNKSMNMMSEKIQKDYKDIHEFTGNISHEIQTPLSIIRQKAETLLQTPPLNEKQVKLINDIQNTTSRLARLNKTLILLTRIENKHFTRLEKVSLKAALDEHIEVFEPIISENIIDFSYISNDDIHLEADPMLIDILLVNLIKNAVSYNIKGGSLSLDIQKDEFIISNSSEAKALDPDEIFNRYTSYSGRNDALGLGLSLAKRICELYSYELKYRFENELHHFSVSFRRPVQEKK